MTKNIRSSPKGQRPLITKYDSLVNLFSYSSVLQALHLEEPQKSIGNKVAKLYNGYNI